VTLKCPPKDARCNCDEVQLLEKHIHLIARASADLNMWESFSFFTYSSAVNNKKYGVEDTIKDNTDSRESKSKQTSTGQVSYMRQKGCGH
jgi:hypothetical protein